MIMQDEATTKDLQFFRRLQCHKVFKPVIIDYIGLMEAAEQAVDTTLAYYYLLYEVDDANVLGNDIDNSQSSVCSLLQAGFVIFLMHLI